MSAATDHTENLQLKCTKQSLQKAICWCAMEASDDQSLKCQQGIQVEYQTAESVRKGNAMNKKRAKRGCLLRSRSK